MIEIYERLVAMGSEAECPGKTAHERMRYLLALVERHGLELKARGPELPAKPTEHC